MPIDLLRNTAILLILLLTATTSHAGQLRAGVAKVEITDREAGPVNDPSFVKALVLKNAEEVAVIITVDAVAIGEIGRIGNDYLAKVRSQLQTELGIPPACVIVNASHCHSVVRLDADKLTVDAVRQAWQAVVPVKVGAGSGKNTRISENRRLKMKDGSDWDMRRAYSMPPDEDVAGVGPIDPQIGILRLDREDGKPLAVLYNFACHPIMNAPNKGNTADFPGVASKVIEESLGSGALALFLQGCCGDINPVRYKGVMSPPDAEPLGNMLGLSVIQAMKKIEARSGCDLKIINEVVALPRGADLERRIAAIQSDQAKLLQSLKPTDINFKTFLPLFVQHRVSPDFPSFYSQGYLHDQSVGKDELTKLDAANRKQLGSYLENIHIMERLTRLNVNLALLKKHLAQNQVADERPIEIEIAGLRIGDFRLITFPGEPTVEIGLNIKRQAPAPFTFVAGYSNGYIYYLPTEKQRANSGYAQEDCDCLVAPQWQKLFETKALEILNKLSPKDAR
jgi:hypothetical protein